MTLHFIVKSWLGPNKHNFAVLLLLDFHNIGFSKPQSQSTHCRRRPRCFCQSVKKVKEQKYKCLEFFFLYFSLLNGGEKNKNIMRHKTEADRREYTFKNLRPRKVNWYLYITLFLTPLFFLLVFLLPLLLLLFVLSLPEPPFPSHHLSLSIHFSISPFFWIFLHELCPYTSLFLKGVFLFRLFFMCLPCWVMYCQGF